MVKKNKQNNDCAQHNKFGMSLVGQVVWDTEAVFFFFFGHSVFPRARVGLVKKKVTRNIDKKHMALHALEHSTCTGSESNESTRRVDAPSK